MKIVYWRRGEFTYCVNLEKVQSIRIGPKVGSDYAITFILDSGQYIYRVPKPLSREQVDSLLRLLQACFVLNLDDVIKGLLKEEGEDKE